MAPKKQVAREADSQYTPHKRVRDEAPVDPSNRRITRLAAIDSPRKAVFNTTELLERIIVHLPMKDIFIIQRVCQRFKNIITTSPTIQTKLFLRLENKPREAWKAVDSALGYRKVSESDKNTKQHITPVTLSPILEMSWFPSIVLGLTRRQLWKSIDTAFKNEYVQITLGAGHLGSHPSFLKMYITDPPCYRACVGLNAEVHMDRGGPDMLEPVYSTVMGDVIENSDGLTLGDVIHARTTVELSTPMLGQLSRKDISLWEMMAEYGCKLIVKPESRPACTLMLLDVCLPTEAQRAAVSSERSGAST